MRDLIQLLLDRTVERRMAMAVEVDPDGGGAIQILLSFRIDQVGPFPSLDNERLLLFPFLHLSEGMPEVSMVPIDQLFRRRWSSHSRWARRQWSTVIRQLSGVERTN